MPSKIRKTLFTSFVILFLFFATSIIAFSLGWRYNFEIFGFEQVGGIYIKTQPKDVIIKIDGETHQDESNIIQSGTLISNLLPKTYNLVLEKEGYHNYEKTVTVLPKKVEEVLSAILIPTTINPERIYSVKGNQLIAQSIDNENFIIKNSQNENLYLYTLSNSSSTLNISASFKELQKNNIKKITFFPFDPSQFIVDDSRSIKVFNPSKSITETIIKEPVIAWQLSGSNLFFIKQMPILKQPLETRIINQPQKYGLFSYNFIFKNETLITEIPNTINASSTKEIRSSNNSFVLLESSGALNLFKKDNFYFKKISSNASAFDISPDGKMLAYASDSPKSSMLTVFFLEEINNNIRKKPGDEITFSIRAAEAGAKISKITWHKEFFHLILNSDDKISIIEIDDRTPQNIYNLFSDPLRQSESEASAGQSLYDSKNDILYIIKNGIFSKIDFSRF